jgi:hypothetical protein
MLSENLTIFSMNGRRIHNAWDTTEQGFPCQSFFLKHSNMNDHNELAQTGLLFAY